MKSQTPSNAPRTFNMFTQARDVTEAATNLSSNTNHKTIN